MLLCGAGAITPAHLGLGEDDLRARPAARAAARPATASSDSSSEGAEASSVHPDRAVIEDALKRSGGIVSKAAMDLGISRQAFYRRMDQAGIVFERRLKIPR
jgi:DNA-binding NtrC family response regulator